MCKVAQSYDLDSNPQTLAEIREAVESGKTDLLIFWCVSAGGGS
jgi:hypothetical protein